MALPLSQLCCASVQLAQRDTEQAPRCGTSGGTATGLPPFDALPLCVCVGAQVWLDRFFLQSLHALVGLSAAQLCGLLSSLGEGGVRPPQQWMARWLAVARPRLSALSGKVSALPHLLYWPRHGHDRHARSFRCGGQRGRSHEASTPSVRPLRAGAGAVRPRAFGASLLPEQGLDRCLSRRCGRRRCGRRPHLWRTELLLAVPLSGRRCRCRTPGPF